MVDNVITRNNFSSLKSELLQPEVLILVGARQVGKTTLLHELRKIPGSEKSKFYDLEQPEDLKLLEGESEKVIEEISSDTEYVFIDEFYYLANAGKIFKAIYDKNARIGRTLKIVASGSSAIEIHSHLQESLAGRMVKIQIYPFSFSEYCKVNLDKKEALPSYLKYGGLPGLLFNPEERKKQLLNDYLSSYLLKDVKSLIKEENIRAFNNLLYHLADSQGQLIEYQNLAREVGLTGPAVKRYLEILDQTYVNFSITSYHSNLSNELKKSRKQYYYDLGVRNAILKDFRHHDSRPDKGCLFETFTFLQLKSICSSNCEIRFWRNKDKREVDFVLVLDREPIPIEVKSSLSKAVVPPGLKSFLHSYPNTKKAFVVNLDLDEEVIHNKCKVQFIRFDAVENILNLACGK